MKKTGFGIKIITVIQLVLCLIFAFAIWISVQYADKYSNNNNNQSAEENTSTASETN